MKIHDSALRHIAFGRPITDEEVEVTAAKSEAGYHVDELLARQGPRLWRRGGGRTGTATRSHPGGTDLAAVPGDAWELLPTKRRRRAEMEEPVGHDTGTGREHATAVLDAEVRLLTDQLQRYGVLSREALARRADADLWHEGTFEAALAAGAERGVITLLPDGLVALREHH